MLQALKSPLKQIIIYLESWQVTLTYELKSVFSGQKYCIHGAIDIPDAIWKAILYIYKMYLKYLRSAAK